MTPGAGLQPLNLDLAVLAAVRVAPRRFRLPPLPADADAAVAAGTETALAFAIEATRLAHEQNAPAPAGTQDLFTRALAELVTAALAPQGGDPAVQAAVLRAQEAQVDEHVRLAERAAADSRAVRSAIDAFAHPGKLQRRPPDAVRDGLLQLHGLAAEGAWAELRQAAQRQWLAQLDDAVQPALAALLAEPALARLERGRALLAQGSVQRYRALCARRGPLAGEPAAAAQGRASAQIGAQAEQATVQAMQQVAELLNRHVQPPHRYRAVAGLRTPAGFPGAAPQTKDEWDAAIVRSTGTDTGAEIVLLAEVKASPAAAATDWSRLLRGLRRLAQSDPGSVSTFASAAGPVRVSGTSLVQLQPPGHALPPHVIYCCTAPADARPQPLGPASKAMLLAEPASLAFALRLARGEPASPRDLAAVWSALTTAPHLRAVLWQDATARAAREAMLHPQDLPPAVAQALRSQRDS